MKKFIVSGIWFIVLFLYTIYYLPATSYAHEAYVLTRSEFQAGLGKVTQNPLGGLFDPAYIRVTAIITLSVVLTYFLAILWSTTGQAAVLDGFIKKAAFAGPLVIRLAISSSFFYAAMANSIFGPELSLTLVPFGNVIRFLLFALSIMVFFGFLTEIAAITGVVIFFFVSLTFRDYMITYANYFGELTALSLFGSRFLSVDRWLFGKKALIEQLEKLKYLEVPLVRILYGIALIYAGWDIKFLHQSLSVEVYNQYHLVNFFHAGATFIASGAGLSEILIGFFILTGFTQRLTVVISLFFITLSLLYFGEMVWPHLMLFGISFSLFINSSDPLTLDRYLIPFVRRILWKKK